MLDSKATFEHPYTPLDVRQGERAEIVSVWRASSEWIETIAPSNPPYDHFFDVNELIELQEQFDAADNRLTQFAINDMMALG